MDEVKKNVREAYGNIAKGEPKCGCSCGCGVDAKQISKGLGYTQEQMSSVPDGANLGLGCGNPTALADIKPGEVVLDLGSGAGFDSFLAAQKVGKSGKVIGVDMTAEMLDRARTNAKKGGYENVEFRLGEIENLPVADNSVDLVISNCVINLSDNKPRVFEEAFRVLKPGGRMHVSDIVLVKQVPERLKDVVAAYTGCFSGAITRDDYLAGLSKAGFSSVGVDEEVKLSLDSFSNEIETAVSQVGLTREQVLELIDSVISAKVTARKPL